MEEEIRGQNVIKSRKLQTAETEAGWEKTLQSDSDLLTEPRSSNVRPWKENGSTAEEDLQ